MSNANNITDDGRNITIYHFELPPSTSRDIVCSLTEDEVNFSDNILDSFENDNAGLQLLNSGEKPEALITNDVNFTEQNSICALSTTACENLNQIPSTPNALITNNVNIEIISSLENNDFEVMHSTCENIEQIVIDNSAQENSDLSLVCSFDNGTGDCTTNKLLENGNANMPSLSQILISSNNVSAVGGDIDIMGSLENSDLELLFSTCEDIEQHSHMASSTESVLNLMCPFNNDEVVGTELNILNSAESSFSIIGNTTESPVSRSLISTTTEISAVTTPLLGNRNQSISETIATVPEGAVEDNSSVRDALDNNDIELFFSTCEDIDHTKKIDSPSRCDSVMCSFNIDDVRSLEKSTDSNENVMSDLSHSSLNTAEKQTMDLQSFDNPVLKTSSPHNFDNDSDNIENSETVDPSENSFFDSELRVNDTEENDIIKSQKSQECFSVDTNVHGKDLNVNIDYENAIEEYDVSDSEMLNSTNHIKQQRYGIMYPLNKCNKNCYEKTINKDYDHLKDLQNNDIDETQTSSVDDSEQFFQDNSDWIISNHDTVNTAELNANIEIQEHNILCESRNSLSVEEKETEYLEKLNNSRRRPLPDDINEDNEPKKCKVIDCTDTIDIKPQTLIGDVLNNLYYYPSYSKTKKLIWICPFRARRAKYPTRIKRFADGTVRRILGQEPFNLRLHFLQSMRTEATSPILMVNEKINETSYTNQIQATISAKQKNIASDIIPKSFLTSNQASINPALEPTGVPRTPNNTAIAISAQEVGTKTSNDSNLALVYTTAQLVQNATTSDSSVLSRVNNNGMQEVQKPTIQSSTIRGSISTSQPEEQETNTLRSIPAIVNASRQEAHGTNTTVSDHVNAIQETIQRTMPLNNSFPRPVNVNIQGVLNTNTIHNKPILSVSDNSVVAHSVAQNVSATENSPFSRNSFSYLQGYPSATIMGNTMPSYAGAFNSYSASSFPQTHFFPNVQIPPRYIPGGLGLNECFMPNYGVPSMGFHDTYLQRLPMTTPIYPQRMFGDIPCLQSQIGQNGNYNYWWQYPSANVNPNAYVTQQWPFQLVDSNLYNLNHAYAQNQVYNTIRSTYPLNSVSCNTQSQQQMPNAQQTFVERPDNLRVAFDCTTNESTQTTTDVTHGQNQLRQTNNNEIISNRLGLSMTNPETTSPNPCNASQPSLTNNQETDNHSTQVLRNNMSEQQGTRNEELLDDTNNIERDRPQPPTVSINKTILASNPANETIDRPQLQLIQNLESSHVSSRYENNNQSQVQLVNDNESVSVSTHSILNNQEQPQTTCDPISGHSSHAITNNQSQQPLPHVVNDHETNRATTSVSPCNLVESETIRYSEIVYDSSTRATLNNQSQQRAISDNVFIHESTQENHSDDLLLPSETALLTMSQNTSSTLVSAEAYHNNRSQQQVLNADKSNHDSNSNQLSLQSVNNHEIISASPRTMTSDQQELRSSHNNDLENAHTSVESSDMLRVINNSESIYSIESDQEQLPITSGNEFNYTQTSGINYNQIQLQPADSLESTDANAHVTNTSNQMILLSDHERAQASTSAMRSDLSQRRVIDYESSNATRTDRPLSRVAQNRGSINTSTDNLQNNQLSQNQVTRDVESENTQSDLIYDQHQQSSNPASDSSDSQSSASDNDTAPQPQRVRTQEERHNQCVVNVQRALYLLYRQLHTTPRPNNFDQMSVAFVTWLLRFVALRTYRQRQRNAEQRPTNNENQSINARDQQQEVQNMPTHDPRQILNNPQSLPSESTTSTNEDENVQLQSINVQPRQNPGDEIPPINVQQQRDAERSNADFASRGSTIYSPNSSSENPNPFTNTIPAHQSSMIIRDRHYPGQQSSMNNPVQSQHYIINGIIQTPTSSIPESHHQQQSRYPAYFVPRPSTGYVRPRNAYLEQGNTVNNSVRMQQLNVNSSTERDMHHQQQLNNIALRSSQIMQNQHSSSNLFPLRQINVTTNSIRMQHSNYNAMLHPSSGSVRNDRSQSNNPFLRSPPISREQNSPLNDYSRQDVMSNNLIPVQQPNGHVLVRNQELINPAICRPRQFDTMNNSNLMPQPDANTVQVVTSNSPHIENPHADSISHDSTIFLPNTQNQNQYINTIHAHQSGRDRDTRIHLGQQRSINNFVHIQHPIIDGINPEASHQQQLVNTINSSEIPSNQLNYSNPNQEQDTTNNSIHMQQSTVHMQIPTASVINTQEERPPMNTANNESPNIRDQLSAAQRRTINNLFRMRRMSVGYNRNTPREQQINRMRNSIFLQQHTSASTNSNTLSSRRSASHINNLLNTLIRRDLVIRRIRPEPRIINIHPIPVDSPEPEENTQSHQENIHSHLENIQSHHENIQSQQENIPSGEENIHSDEENIHSHEENIQSHQEHIQSQQENIPSGEENIHSEEENIYSHEENIQSHQENIPSGKENIHSDEENIPSGEENIPSGEENIHSDEENIYSHEENIQLHQENIPSGEENIHSDEENIHAHEENIQSYQENIQSHQENIPSGEENIHSDEENIHSHEGNIQSHQENIPSDDENIQSHQENIPSDENMHSDEENIHSHEENIQSHQENIHSHEENIQSDRSNESSSDESVNRQIRSPQPLQQSVEIQPQAVNNQQQVNVEFSYSPLDLPPPMGASPDWRELNIPWVLSSPESDA